MKVAVITIEPCFTVRELGACSYVGYRIYGDRVEHLVIAGGRSGSCRHAGKPKVVKFRKRCDECVLGMLLRRSALVTLPTLSSDGSAIRFVVVYSRAVRALLKERGERVVSVKVLDLRRVLLTHRQRLALRLVASGTPISKVAAELGITKQAARKLLGRLMRKLAEVMA